MLKNGTMAGICLLAAALTAGAGAEPLSGAGPGWFSSEKSYAPGDLVTVIVAESAQAQQSASTALNKESQVGYSTGGALGTVLPGANVGVSTNHDGGGQLSRQGKMSAKVSVRVEEILPNGSLKIKGEQEIRFESGAQLIRLAGIIRPADISAQNEIYSFRMADAKIEYTGDGALHEKARTGFLSRFLDWLWIF